MYMQTCIKRVFSMMLVMALVLSCLPLALAAEDTTVTAVAENLSTQAQYDSINDAIASAAPGQIVKALADAQDVVYDNEGVILDLNGHDLDVTVPAGVTLSAIDSATDDFEGAFGTLTTDGTVAATVKTTGDIKSYVTVAESGSYSFHRYYAAIAAISLKPSQAALGYRAEFRGDETVKNAVVGYGYEMWLNDGAHKTYSRTDAMEKSSLTLRLQNILAEGNDALNALGSTATIGGNAFMTLELNGQQVTLYGTEQTTTLRQVVESINSNAGKYGEAQLAPVRAMCTTYAPWMMGWATENIFGAGEGDGDDSSLDVEITVDVTAENNILTQDATLSYNGVTAIVPQGTQLDAGTTQLVLTITEKASSDSDVTEGEGETLIPLDVHIAGISESNTTPIIICLGQILPKGLNIGNYDLHHVEDGKTVPMTRVYTLEELDAHNEFHYDPATGAVTVAMASFSELTLLTNNENQWNGETDTIWYNAEESIFEIHNADQLAGLGALVDGGNTFASKTITMIGDINLYGVNAEGNRYNFDPIGFGYAYDTTNGRAFKGTFDGNGNTIYNLYQNCWDLGAETYTYSTAGAGLFASVENAIIKNLTMDGASLVLECIDMGTVVGYAQGNCTFENIVVKNSALANYQRYTGGAIGEVSNGHHILKNVDVEDSTTVGTLWGDFDASVGGIIGGKWGHNYNNAEGLAGQKVSVYMENCDVAATLDVYNDVTSAYQWYSYRRAGMLIGFPNESKQDENGRTEATASFLETKNCTVQYGDWVNYHYCEFTNTTSLNARYPWVRVEAGKNCGAYSNPRYGVPQFTNTELDIEYHAEDDGCHVDGDGHDVLIVFNQLYGGGQGCYGGNAHIDNGVTVIGQNGNPVVAAPKFTCADSIYAGATVKLGELFQAIDGVDIQDAYVYAFVSPVNAEDSVRGTTAEPKANTNWQDLTITFSGTGLAKVTISDYYYCQPTTLIVNVKDGQVTGTTATIDFSTADQRVSLDSNSQVWSNGGLTVTNNKASTNTDVADYKNPVRFYKNSNLVIAFPGMTKIEIVSEENKGSDNAYFDHLIESLADDFTYTTNDTTVIITLPEATDSLTITLSGGQVRMYSITVYANDSDSSICDHAGCTTTTTTTEPTCTKDGVTIVTCDGCGGQISSTKLPALEHTFVEGVCTTCGSIEVSFPEIPETGKYELVTDIADIKAGGKFVIVAKVGDAYYAMNTYGDGKVSSTPVTVSNDCVTTENAPAWLIGRYGVDKIAIKTNDKNYLAHSSATSTDLHDGRVTFGWSIISGEAENAFYVVSPTVQEGKSARYIMYRGGESGDFFKAYASTNISINSTSNVYYADLQFYKLIAEEVCEHSYTSVVTQEANCTETGIMTYTCANCGNSYTEVIPTNDNHSYNSVVTAPTCNAAGYTTYTCSRCEHSYKVDGAPATGKHNYVNGTCDVCDAEDPDNENGETTYAFVKTDLSQITSNDIVVITMTNNSGTYAMSNNNGTNSAPGAVKVTVEGNQLGDDIAESIKWNIGSSADNYTIYPNGTTDKWLYATSTNNGVRVGTNTSKIFTVDTTSGYLVHNGTNRYIGIYNSQDWRCYTSVNNNIQNQTLTFYVWKKVDSSEGGGETPNDPVQLAVFEFGNESSKDNTTAASTYSEESGTYKLNLSGSNLFVPSKSGSEWCLKLGSSKSNGSFNFVVPDNVSKVVIYAARYGSDTSSITVAGTLYNLTAEYTKIEIDTTPGTTISVSATKRVLINTMEFWGNEN